MDSRLIFLPDRMIISRGQRIEDGVSYWFGIRDTRMHLTKFDNVKLKKSNIKINVFAQANIL